MLEDFRLKVFMAVAAERSFTKAASVLGITQPAVSQNIADLEKMTGRKLFDRQRGAVVLTAEGEVFMNYVAKLQGIHVQVDDMFAKLSPATVKISASEELYTYLIGPALETFIRIHPEIAIERCIFEDADLAIALAPSGTHQEDIIARIRMSVSDPKTDHASGSSYEKISCFDVLFRPSQKFACTRLCRLIAGFIRNHI